MRLAIRAATAVLAFIIIAIIAVWLLLPWWNDRQVSGEIALDGLNAPVRIVRDSNSMPYIYAQSMQDALRAQGFVTGQDRLFQLEVAKRAASGQLAEVLGAGDNDVILNLDREARTIGFTRVAARQEAILSPQSRATLDIYLDGLNSYIRDHSNTHPMEFGLAGFEPETWSKADLLSVAFFLGWGSAANFNAELIAHEIIQVVGEERFSEIAPLAINPDAQSNSNNPQTALRPLPRWKGQTAKIASWSKDGWREQGHGGSNNWAVSGMKAGQNAAIVTNDPHLDARLLPGPWHPIGIITPDHRIVGVSAGLPGISIGRNQHIAFGVTNAYADAIDLYVETIDPQNPDNYLEGTTSIPLTKITEIIRVKDDTAKGGMREEKLLVRATKRGPLITDHKEDISGDAHLSVRWATAEYLSPELGVDTLMLSTNLEEALEAVANIRIVSLNFVMGDVSGRVARRASGAAPIRLRGDGMTPFPVTDGNDNWAGPIPGDQMPSEIDPERGWTGTANHLTAPDDYPYIYTTYASPPYRYRRIKEVMSAPQVSAQQSWDAQYDTLNLLARDLSPIFAEALSDADYEGLREVGSILQEWDHRDETDALAPTLFQEIIRQLARLTVQDELGPKASAAYLSNWYVWQNRFDAMVQEGTSAWFDDVRTPAKEDRRIMIQRAATVALEMLEKRYGKYRSQWLWGKVHTIQFQGPLRQSGLIGTLTGNRKVAIAGSGETLLRSLYPYDDPYGSRWFASLRMTADMNDNDKVRAVLPGGAVGRSFNAHLGNQIDSWMDKDAETYWWFSDTAIEADAQSTLTLNPNSE